METSSLYDMEMLRACNDVWARLPTEARHRLQHVKVTTGTPRYIADAGHNDVRVRPSIGGSSAALRGILVHELAHVYLGHHAALLNTTKSTAECEAEADALARQWGFGDDLRERQFFYRR